MKVKIVLPSAGKLIRDLGLAEYGAVQTEHTKNVLGRLRRYMKFNTGMTHDIANAQTDIRKPEIIVDVPYARYLYFGKKMVNAKTGKGPMLIPGVGLRYKKGTILKATDENLVYTNKSIKPYWDKVLVAKEGAAMVEDLQRFIDRRGGR